jgi:hypothetical protein
MYLRAVTPTRNCTLNSLVMMPGNTNGTVNMRPVVYPDSGGTPNGQTLMSGGSTVTGMTAGTMVTLPLTTPQSLTAGATYWLGIMVDTGIGTGITGNDALVSGRSASATFTSGAPGTCPTTGSGAATPDLNGVVTLSVANNTYEFPVSPGAPQGLNSYLTDTTVGHEDLYNMGALSQLPSSIYAVQVSALCARSDSGARTVSMRTSSGGTDSGGSLTGQTPNASNSFGYLTSVFLTDPNTGAAWLGTNLNNALAGFKIDS